MAILMIGAALVIGIILGAIITTRIQANKPIGCLRVTNDDGETYLSLVLHKDIQSVISKKRVTFTVDITKGVPRK